MGIFYGWIALSDGNDFGVSGDGTGEVGRFAYSGAVFIGIAIVLLMFKKKRSAKVGAFFLFLCLMFVASRGLFLTLALTAFCHTWIARISTIRKLGLSFVVILLAAACLPLLFSLAGDRTASDSTRLDTLSQVFEQINPESTIVGHGFGIGVPERPEHMEIVYLEIFHKQGALGLLWWIVLIGMLVARFKGVLGTGDTALAYSLFLVALFVLLESATNPYLNNPVGMYPFLISFVALGVLTQRSNPPAGAIQTLAPDCP